MTDEKWINWTLVRRLNHGRMSRALSLEAGDRIEELEASCTEAYNNGYANAALKSADTIADLQAKLDAAEEEIASLLTEYSIDQEQEDGN